MGTDKNADVAVPQSGHYIELASTLSDRVDVKFKPGQEKLHVDALVQQMRADRLLALPVPESSGVDGLRLIDIARITFEIARQSGSAGLIYAMHMSQAFTVVRHGIGPHFEAFQQKMLGQQLLIASGTSEKGLGGDILHSLCNISDSADGRLYLAKESPNVSYLDHASAILVTANWQATNRRKSRQVLVLVETGVGGDQETRLSPGPASEFFGMRGILNRPWKIEASFPVAAVFPAPFGGIARGTMTPVIHILWAALWSGIAASVLTKAKLFASSEIPADADITPVIQHSLTRLIDRHYMMNAMIRDAIREFDSIDAGSDGLGFARAARINRLKVCASELVEEICQGALHIIGMRGYATSGSFSITEEIADARSAGIMVSNTRLAVNTAKIENFILETI